MGFGAGLEEVWWRAVLEGVEMSSYHPFLSFAAVTGREGTKTYSFPLLPCNAVQLHTLFSAQLYFSVLPIIIPEGEMAMLSGGNVLLPAVLIICQ